MSLGDVNGLCRELWGGTEGVSVYGAYPFVFRSPVLCVPSSFFLKIIYFLAVDFGCCRRGRTWGSGPKALMRAPYFWS